MLLVQKWPFFQLFFLGNIGQENVFYDILERKNAFLDYKNKKLKKSKNWHFFKGVNPWFLSKNGHFFFPFFLSNIGQENFFYDYLERKVAFPRYKIKEVQKSKDWHFSEGVNPWFSFNNCHFANFLVQKWPFFQLFFLSQLRLGKCLLRYSRTENRLSRL